MLGKGGAIVLGVLLTVGSVVPCYAGRRPESCDRKIQKAQHNLDVALRKHGEGSRQVARKRQKLEQAHAKCRNRM